MPGAAAATGPEQAAIDLTTNYTACSPHVATSHTATVTATSHVTDQATTMHVATSQAATVSGERVAGSRYGR